MKSLSLLIALLAFVAAPLSAQRSSLGDVVIGVDKNTVPVRVSANTAELNDLALRAFGAHGRYKLVASGQAFDIAFTAVSQTQVRVDVSKVRGYAVEVEPTNKKNGKSPAPSPKAGGGSATVIHSETVSGTSARNALLRAADVAVERTNGLGLKGFFASKITFIRDQGRVKEVCTSDLFFGEAKQLSHNNALSLMPRWAAQDGSKIIYTSFYKSNSADIFLLDVASGRHTVFAKFQGTNQAARFSPNWQQVAMVLSGEGTPEIYVANAQGGQVSRKTRSDQVKSSPCWSPDGSRIVFTSEPGPQLYVMSPSGAGMSRLSTGFTYCAEPDWSRANPKKIAITVRTADRRYQIAVFDFDKGRAEVVSKAEFDGIEPSWLPDGRHLVYTARDRNSSVLSILDTETGLSKRISATNLGPVAQASVLAQ